MPSLANPAASAQFQTEVERISAVRRKRWSVGELLLEITVGDGMTAKTGQPPEA